MPASGGLTASVKRRTRLGTKFAANLGMASVQLDQFIYALIWKAGPIVILFGCGVIVLRQLVRRIARRVRLSVHARTDRPARETPHCPSCDRPMVKRTVRRGFRAGSEFWGCSNYPACSDTRPLTAIRSRVFDDRPPDERPLSCRELEPK